MNVDEVHDVIPICKENKILFPLEGVIRGHYKKNEDGTYKIINQLSEGVPMIVKNKKLTPNSAKNYTVGDLITGYGVAESVIHYYDIYRKSNIKDKKIIIQGWGNVAAAAAYYLSQSGGKIVGIIDLAGGIINEKGLSFKEVTSLFENRSSNLLENEKLLSFDETNNKIWSIGADIFYLAAASRLLSQNQLDSLIDNGLEVISSGANVPFADKEIFFGPISKSADDRISVIPDFIANCGMARVFAYLMQDNQDINDTKIFKDTSKTIYNALLNTFSQNKTYNNISKKTAFEIALKQLV